MAAPIDLNVAKKNLHEALGDEMKSYLHNLKSWFKQKISKEEFDMEARKMMKSDTVHLHNEFLLAIISKCQSLSPSMVPKSPPSVPSQSHVKLLKRGKLKKRPPSARSNFQQRFVPVNPTACAVQATYKGSEDAVFASRELSLPDISMVHGRLLVCAWEAGLQDVNDSAVKLLVHAVETQLKNIISQVLSRRNGYKMRENCFPFSMGCDVPNPYTRHRNMLNDTTIESGATMISPSGSHVPSKHLPLDCSEGYSAEHLSTALARPVERGPVTLYNLLEALQISKTTIPSHSVYVTAIERIIHKLWHPSRDELQSQQAVSLPDTYQAPVR